MEWRSRSQSIRHRSGACQPVGRTPEVVRAGWLVSQLQGDVPIFVEQVHREGPNRFVALASLMVILAAAETIELSRCDEATIQLAIENWQIAIPTSGRCGRGVNPLVGNLSANASFLAYRAPRALDKMLVGIPTRAGQ